MSLWTRTPCSPRPLKPQDPARALMPRHGGFFFSRRRRHTRCSRDWSSDVCSSDLASLWQEFGVSGGAASFASLPFDHPLYILYSSGTTGRPKCIVHGAGGTLLQHHKERSEERRVGKECRSRWSPYH